MEESIGYIFAFLFCFGAIFAFLKLGDFIGQNATRVKKIDPESKAGIDHSIKFGAWSLVVIFILIVFGSLIGRGQGWWGN